MAAKGDGSNAGDGWSIEAPSVANLKSNVKYFASSLRNALALDGDGGAFRQGIRDASSMLDAARERKDQFVDTGIAHSRALAADVGDKVEEGEKAAAQADAFVRREPLWAIAGLGAFVTVASLRRGPIRALGRGIFTAAAGFGFLAYTAITEEDEHGLPRE